MAVGTGTFNTQDGKWYGHFKHENGAMIHFNVTPPPDMSSNPDEAAGDQAVQDLIDYVAEWEKLGNEGPVGGRARFYAYPITVTEEP